MTKDERLNWLKQIEKDINVCSLDATFEETAKSCAIRSAIEELEERKTGRWEFVSYGDGLGNYHCSECRAIASSYFVGNLVNRHWEYKLTKYCPNCGAKMEGADNGTD